MEEESKRQFKSNNYKSKKKGKFKLFNIKNLIKQNPKNKKLNKKEDKQALDIDNNINTDIINNKNKIKKERNPGVDLVRLISMYTVIIQHFVIIKEFNKYDRYKKQINIFTTVFHWHIDAFAMISGVVGYKSHKYSNLLYLYLTVLFYSVGINFYFNNIKNHNYKHISFRDDMIYPMIYNRRWYFTSYFGMYLFLPVINNGISIISQYELLLVVISTLGIFIFWKDYNKLDRDVFGINNGHTPFFFWTLYITGVYIGKYRKDYTGFKKFIYCLICASLYLILSYAYYKDYNNEFNLGSGYYANKIRDFIRILFKNRYDSGVRVIQSIVVISFFMQIKYNKYIAKVICFLGPLTFSIYLIHLEPIAHDTYFSPIIKNAPSNLSLNSVFYLLLSKSLKVSFICIVIDYFRFLLFSILRLKKIG